MKAGINMEGRSLTKFGQIVRKLRIDESMLLKEMADALGVSSSQLSSIEMGRKSVPKGMIEKISDLFDLGNDDKNNLAAAAEASKAAYRLNNVDPGRRDVAAALARHINELSAEEVDQIRDVLHRRRG